MSADELEVMLQGVCTTTSANYDPKNLCRSPILAARRWSYLNYNTQFYEGTYFMVCYPPSNYKSNFSKALRRHRVAKREWYHFEGQLPMSAETYGGIEVYAIKNQEQHWM